MLLSVQETTIRRDVISSKSSHATFKNAFKKNMSFVTCHLQQNGTVFVRANQLLKKNQSTAQVVVRTNQQKFCLDFFFSSFLLSFSVQSICLTCFLIFSKQCNFFPSKLSLLDCPNSRLDYSMLERKIFTLVGTEY